MPYLLWYLFVIGNESENLLSYIFGGREIKRKSESNDLPGGMLKGTCFPSFLLISDLGSSAGEVPWYGNYNPKSSLARFRRDLSLLQIWRIRSQKKWEDWDSLQSNWIIYFEDHSEIKDEFFNGIILICKKMATDKELRRKWERPMLLCKIRELYDVLFKRIKNLKFAFDKWKMW